MVDGSEGSSQSPAQPVEAAKLSLTQVYTLAYAATLSRGYPGPIPDEIAGRVLWLEQRGLPGLIALAREFLNNHDTDFRERGMQCPIIAGALLPDHFDELVSREPSRPNVIEGPTNGVLLLPVVAQYAKKIGEPVRVSWIMGEPAEIVGQSIVDADSVASFGDINALILNSGVGFARHDEPLIDGRVAEACEAQLPKEVFEPLLGFIGKQRLETALKVEAVLASDSETLDLLRAMTAADRSMLAAPNQLESDDTVNLVTTHDSSNDKLWTRFKSYGWTTPAAEDPPEELAKITVHHALTGEGRQAMPMLLHALDRFPPMRH